jgi:hypothetical protein
MSRFLSATVGFDVCNPRIFCRVFLFLGVVEQQVEPGEVRIAFDNGLYLLVLDDVHLTNRCGEGVNQPLLDPAKPYFVQFRTFR